MLLIREVFSEQKEKKHSDLVTSEPIFLTYVNASLLLCLFNSTVEHSIRFCKIFANVAQKSLGHQLHNSFSCFSHFPSIARA